MNATNNNLKSTEELEELKKIIDGDPRCYTKIRREYTVDTSLEGLPSNVISRKEDTCSSYVSLNGKEEFLASIDIRIELTFSLDKIKDDQRLNAKKYVKKYIRSFKQSAEKECQEEKSEIFCYNEQNNILLSISKEGKRSKVLKNRYNSNGTLQETIEENEYIFKKTSYTYLEDMPTLVAMKETVVRNKVTKTTNRKIYIYHYDENYIHTSCDKYILSENVKETISDEHKDDL